MKITCPHVDPTYGNAVYSRRANRCGTPIFQRHAAEVWTDSERIEFINWIAANPDAGDVIPGSGGCRKIRWASSGRGKRGGARVIYFNATEETIWLLIVYTKSKFDNLPTDFLAQLRQGVEDAL